MSLHINNTHVNLHAFSHLHGYFNCGQDRYNFRQNDGYFSYGQDRQNFKQVNNGLCNLRIYVLFKSLFLSNL